MNKIKDLLFEEKYRPGEISEICLPDKFKKAFAAMIENKEIPNLLLYGYTGIGKTTIAKILVNRTDSEYLFINGSENRGIDTLRTDIKDFVSTVSLNGLPKVVIIDEADNLSPQTIAALRGFIEEHVNNARFIFTAENIDKFPKAITGRLKCVEFRFNEKENKEIKKIFFERLVYILKEEKINFDKTQLQILLSFIDLNFPGLRKIIVNLQQYLHLNNGIIDIGLLKSQSEKVFGNLCVLLKERNFSKVRQLIKNEINEDSVNYMKMIYDFVEDIFDESSISDSIIIIGEYMYRDNSMRSKEINFSACCMQLMKLKFK